VKRAFVALAALLGWVRDAEACDDLHRHTSVVGVAEDGTFLTEHSWSGGVECPVHAIEIRSAAGEQLGMYEEAPDSSPGCLPQWWRVTGQVPLAARRGEMAGALIGRLAGKLGVQALRPSRQRLGLRQDFRGTCLSVSLGTASGALPLWSQLLTHFGDCVPVKVSAFESPRSALLFVAYRYARPGPCSARAEGVHWLTPDEIDASRHLLRAGSSFAQGKYKAAARAAETALARSPGLIPARVLLARALVRADTPWSLAQGRLSSHYHYARPLECRDGSFESFVQLFGEAEFAAWREDEAFAPWLDREHSRHEEAHGDEGPLAGWDRR
jgi:hypothetical protein